MVVLSASLLCAETLALAMSRRAEMVMVVFVLIVLISGLEAPAGFHPWGTAERHVEDTSCYSAFLLLLIPR